MYTLEKQGGKAKWNVMVKWRANLTKIIYALELKWSTTMPS